MARTAEQQKKSTERTHMRRARMRAERRAAAQEGEAVDVDSGERYEVAIYDSDGTQTKNKAPVVEENLKLLRTKPAEKIEEALVQQRTRYAAMQTHMEIAAAVIAAGGNNTLAARKAGVSKRQIRKYFESAAFRERIQEMQEVLGGRIRGRVMKEVERRTSPELIRKMEILDLLRVGDRFGLGRGNASTINIDNREIHNYESTFAAVILSDADEEGEDFPTYESSDLSLPGGSAPE